MCVYLYVCVCVCVYIYIYIYIRTHTNFVEHNKHFLSTYFLLDPFILPYCFYRIQRELIDVFSIIVYIPSTFCLTSGDHQGRIYYKSDVTFVFALGRLTMHLSDTVKMLLHSSNEKTKVTSLL